MSESNPCNFVDSAALSAYLVSDDCVLSVDFRNVPSPSDRKSESRVFPAELPLTLSYLLRFILANASGAVRTAFFYSQCDASCRATTAYKTRRQAALVRRRQLSGARRTLARHTAELARLRRALRMALTARTERDGL